MTLKIPSFLRIALLIGCFTTIVISPVQAAKMDPNKKIKDLEAQVSILKKKVEALEERLKMTDDVASLAYRMAGTLDSSAFWAFDGAGFISLGPHWQASKVNMLSHAQGCVIEGKILNRRSVIFHNVIIKTKLYDKSTMFPVLVSEGVGELRSAYPGQYSDFRILMRTDRPLSEFNGVRIELSEAECYTSPLSAQGY